MDHPQCPEISAFGLPHGTEESFVELPPMSSSDVIISLDNKPNTSLSLNKEESNKLCDNGIRSSFSWFLKLLLDILEVLVTFLLTFVILVPLLLLWYCPLILVRLILSVFLRLKYDGRIRLMEAFDAAWGLTSYANDNCFTNFFILRGTPDILSIKKRVKYSIEVQEKTNMRARIIKKLGFYCWDVGHKFNVEQHVEEIQCKTPMDKEQVFAFMQTFMDNPPPEDKPRWMIYIITKFKYEDEPSVPFYAVIWRINHSICDGISAINLLQTAVSDGPVKMTIDTVNPPKFNLGFIGTIYLYLEIIIFGPRLVWKSLLFKQTSEVLKGPKSFAWSKAISINALKQMKDELRTNTTSILQSSMAGALRTIQRKNGIQINKMNTFIGATTSAIIPYPDYGCQNRFTVASFPLPDEESDPLKRLKSTEKVVKKYANPAQLLKNYMIISKVVGLNPWKIVDYLMGELKASYLLSNVPGPAGKYELFDGHELKELLAWNTIKGRTGIGLCLLSYAGCIRGSLIVDATALPDPQDAKRLMDAFDSELLELAKVCGMKEQTLFPHHHHHHVSHNNNNSNSDYHDNDS